MVRELGLGIGLERCYREIIQKSRVREMMIEYDEDDGMIERDYRDWEKEI